jgi:hypothetical protein
MKKMIFLSFLALVGTTGFAQKTVHDPNVEMRTVSGSFHAIEVSGGIDLYVSSGDEAVAVSAKDAEVRSHIKTEIRDGVLKIWYEWKDGFKIPGTGNRALRAYVSYKNLDRLSASGGSDVSVDGTIQSNNLSLSLSGGSDFSGKVSAGTLTVHQNGGSDVDISGTTGTLEVSASGGSDFDGYGLVSDTCTISASGGSDANITVNKELTAEASGASDISWKGTAAVKKARASGAGSVSHKS